MYSQLSCSVIQCYQRLLEAEVRKGGILRVLIATSLSYYMCVLSWKYETSECLQEHCVVLTIHARTEYHTKETSTKEIKMHPDSRERDKVFERHINKCDMRTVRAVVRYQCKSVKSDRLRLGMKQTIIIAIKNITKTMIIVSGSVEWLFVFKFWSRMNRRGVEMKHRNKINEYTVNFYQDHIDRWIIPYSVE